MSASTLPSRTLGTDGPEVSVVGLGGNNFGRPGSASVDLQGTDAVISAALDAGVTLLDTADIYNAGVSETLVGQVLKNRRDQMLIATKFGGGGAPDSDAWGAKGSATYVRQACEASLRRLQTDHIDLYQMHTPDTSTPIEETVGALAELVQAGKVRYLGHSNFSAEQVRAADAAARQAGVRFVSAQDEFSLLKRGMESDGRLATLEELGIGLLPYFPLASGLLTGKYSEGNAPAGSRLAENQDRLTRMLGDKGWDVIEQYRTVCAEAGVSMLQASIAWLVSRTTVASVIAGATTPDQVRANAEAGTVSLDDATLARIDELFA